jgi:hypothetical protein
MVGEVTGPAEVMMSLPCHAACLSAVVLHSAITFGKMLFFATCISGFGFRVPGFGFRGSGVRV